LDEHKSKQLSFMSFLRQIQQTKIIKFLGGRYVVVTDFWNGTYCHHCTESDVFPTANYFMPVFHLFLSINVLLVGNWLLALKQWTTIKRAFDNVLRPKFSQENFWTERTIPLVTHDKVVKLTPLRSLLSSFV